MKMWVGVTATAVAMAMAANVNAADLEPVATVEAEPAGVLPYVALRGGGSWYDDTQFSIAGPATVLNRYDDTPAFVTIALGGQYGSVRGEVEVGFFNGGIDSHSAIIGGATTDFAADESFGGLRSRTMMANAFYDFDFGSIKPFVGAGVGFGWVRADNFGTVATGQLLDDGDRGFAWQVTAGIAYEVMEGLDLEVGYRYQDIMNVNLVALDGTRSEFDFSAHHVFAGIRAAF